MERIRETWPQGKDLPALPLVGSRRVSGGGGVDCRNRGGWCAEIDTSCPIQRQLQTNRPAYNAMRRIAGRSCRDRPAIPLHQHGFNVVVRDPVIGSGLSLPAVVDRRRRDEPVIIFGKRWMASGFCSGLREFTVRCCSTCDICVYSCSAFERRCRQVCPAPSSEKGLLINSNSRYVFKLAGECPNVEFNLEDAEKIGCVFFRDPDGYVLELTEYST